MRRPLYVTTAAVTLFTGCGSLGQLGTPPLGARVASSWMSAGAKTHDLLYISDISTNDVYVYSYPQGTLAGTLRGFQSPVRVCSDANGNVYITNTHARQILEYAHGGMKPIATYDDKGFLPTDCSVDPTTGTLAVANTSAKRSSIGSIAIYKKGVTTPKIYHAANVVAYLFCAYDGAGNLYVNGLNSAYDTAFIEKPHGAKKFQPIALDHKLGGWGGVQWDGKYVAVGDGSSTVYDFAIGGGKGKRVKTIHLTHAVNVVQFWLDGSTLAAPDGPDGARHDAGLWHYPQGGKPIKTIGSGVFENPSGATVSRAR
ncbi:MAG TPA: hypothetical protein VFE16_11175 [Candidatus Cybelea sp.]|jgi:hypothetical protein|nr:hypothetical protein [Candidatus Cybelea sp.]